MAEFPQSEIIFSQDPTWTAEMARPEFMDWLSATMQIFGAKAPQSLTISSGQISPDRCMVIVDTEGAAATDDLTAISASDLHVGAVLMLMAADSSRVVTVKHGVGVGGIALSAATDMPLPHDRWLCLRLTGDRWAEFRPHVAEATPSAPGLMPSADKTKLNGVETGAQKCSSILKSEITAKLTGTVAVTCDLSVTGNIVATGNVSAYSDLRLKSDLQRIESALDKVALLTGYTFNVQNLSRRQTGLIAQDVEAVLPEAVHGVSVAENEAYLAIAYGNLAGLLVEAVKELAAKIADIEQRLP